LLDQLVQHQLHGLAHFIHNALTMQGVSHNVSGKTVFGTHSTNPE
jgi:hypothetical protein